MFPHEKALVERHQDKPFVLIGVNSDRDRAAIQGKNAEHGINWRSFWNGPKGAQGPISARWGVRGWPELFLIDHKGVLRRHWAGSPEGATLDREVDALVEAAVEDR